MLDSNTHEKNTYKDVYQKSYFGPRHVYNRRYKKKRAFNNK